MVTSWTDHPASGQTPIRAIHINELRAAVESARAAYPPPPGGWVPWSDHLVTTDTPIRVQHFLELKAAILQLWDKKGMAPYPLWEKRDGADPTPDSPMYAADINDLRRWQNQFEYKGSIRGYHTVNAKWIDFDVPADGNQPCTTSAWQRWAFNDDVDDLRKLELGWYDSCKVIIYHYVETGVARQFWRDNQKERIRRLNRKSSTATRILRLDHAEFPFDMANPYANGQYFGDYYAPILQDVLSVVIPGSHLRVEIANEPNLRDDPNVPGPWNEDPDNFNPWFRGAVDRLRALGITLPYGYPGLSPSGGAQRRADEWLRDPGTADTIKNYANWVGVHTYWPTGQHLTAPLCTPGAEMEVGLWHRCVRSILNDGGVPPTMPLQITEYGNGDPLDTCNNICKGIEYRDWLNQVWADIQAGWGVEQCQAFITNTCTLENPDWDRFILTDSQIEIMRQGGGGG